MNNCVPIYLRNHPPPHEVFDHKALITFMAKWVKPNVYVEYGIRDCHVIKDMVSLCGKCIGVDIQKPNNVENMNFEFYNMRTDDFKKILVDRDIKIDMAFIDADHSHESSLRDFDNLFPHVVEDGFIFLHDTYPINTDYLNFSLCGDSYKTAWYIRKNYGEKCEIVTLPFQPGLSIVKKCKKQMSWLDS